MGAYGSCGLQSIEGCRFAREGWDSRFRMYNLVQVERAHCNVGITVDSGIFGCWWETLTKLLMLLKG